MKSKDTRNRQYVVAALVLIGGLERQAALIVRMYLPRTDRRLDEAYARFTKLRTEWLEFGMWAVSQEGDEEKYIPRAVDVRLY